MGGGVNSGHTGDKQLTCTWVIISGYTDDAAVSNEDACLHKRTTVDTWVRVITATHG